MSISAESPRAGRVRVVVATTVLLSFITFWRAAAIVLGLAKENGEPNDEGGPRV